MEKRLLLSGLERTWAEAITARFGPPAYKVEWISKARSLAAFPESPPPTVAVIGATNDRFTETVAIIRGLKATAPDLPIILINGRRSEAQAIAAFRAGVSDYFSEPLPYAQLFAAIHRLLKHTPAPAASPDPSEARTGALAAIVGRGSAMQQMKRYLLRVAGSACAVLITGETGTGKELVAQTIHHGSSRAAKAMVCVNCAALPEHLVESELFGFRKGAFTGAFLSHKGKFELAHQGTLFLDEIGEMSSAAQAKILRSIENNAIYPLGSQQVLPLDVRIIAATNRNPEALVDEGRFRPDLYYRLNVAHIHLPPLRERKEDIPELAARRILQLNRRSGRSVDGLSPEALAALAEHPWPGNIRELNNLIESSHLNCQTRQIQFSDFPPAFSQKVIYYRTHAASEKDHLLDMLRATRWNKSETARKLNWSRMRIYRALKRYNLTNLQP
jgi:DNA-binding NtrC family response regulator